MGYQTAEYQKARVIDYIARYKEEHNAYPRRQQIADELDISLAYAVELTRQLANEGIIKTSPPWDKNNKQWTVIVGLKRGAAQSAIKVIS
jgi:DNA-directed RNA polymerase specialized sigma subunit